MLLSPDDAALFYRAWSALLTWVNDRRSIAPRFARPTPEHPLDPSLANKIKDVVWAEDALREEFLAEGSADLGPEERDLVASWTHRVSGNFVILKHLQKHSVFLKEDAYGVLGIYTPLEMMFPSVPVFFEAVLIPFRDVIITDGLLRSPGYTSHLRRRRSPDVERTVQRSAGGVPDADDASRGELTPRLPDPRTSRSRREDRADVNRAETRWLAQSRDPR